MNEQEILEKEYNALLENRNATGGEIANSLSRQKKNLEQQQALQQELLRLNKYYMQDLLNNNKDLQKYANYNWGTGVVEINADAIGKIVNEEEGKRVTEYISELEKFRDQINDANGSLLEIDNSVKEIEKQGQDERLDLEQRVLDALTKQHQDEIDALTELDEDINEASEDFISAMEEAIAKERQERENAEKEQSIRDKETRLAYLKRDTTGGNQQEIKQLEKELADEKQDYSDNLIDQKLEELRKQNDEASEQRQEQIELLQKQLEELQENPDWDEIYRIINSSMAANGTLIKGSELDKLLKENEDYGSKSDVGKDVWEEELDKTFGAAAGYVSNSRQLEKLSDKERGVSKGGKVTFINAEGKKISGTYLGDGQGTVEVKNGGYKYLYTDVYRDYDGTYRQTSATPKGQEINPIPEIKDPKPTKPAQPAKKEEPKKETAKPATPAKKEQPKKETVSYFSKPSYSGTSIVDGLKTSVYGKDTKKWPSNKTLYNKVGTLEQIAKANGITGKTADRNTKMLKKLKEGKLKKYKAFAHGGLVDFTGPAWLDGTKTRPEAFLSADDTKNFMELKDVLSSVKKAQNRNTAVSNNASFVINVKVDKIDNDYDVDRLVSRVKQDILQNSQYRNVTSINFRK